MRMVVDYKLFENAELRRYTLASTHCSALVKLLPDYSELYVGHNMWWGYHTVHRCTVW